MQAVGGRARIGRAAKRGPNKYPTRLQFYRQHPEMEIEIDELESCAADRLHVLRVVESAVVRKGNEDDFRRLVQAAEDKYLPLHLTAADPTILDQERRKDHISHFILRLAYCRTEDLRRWFVAQEVALFRHRFNYEPLKDRNDFMAANNLSVRVVTDSEKESLRGELYAACSHVPNVENEDFYRVPFEDVPELVRSRRVYVKAGEAYVAASDLVTILVNIFRTELRAALEATHRVLPLLEEDDRLLPKLIELTRQSSAPDYISRTGGEAITADQVDSLVQHFPLCMRDMHSNLVHDSHLRHFGRIQLGLFLKGMGLDLQESLIYWRRAFSAKISDDKFNKQYAYNVRYNYGQEGKREDFKPYDCMRMIMNNPPGAGDHHGCPFRSYDADNLRATMRGLEVPDSSINEIIDLVRNQHYQFACTRYYEATHKPDGNQVPTITHPNQYFDLSMGRASTVGGQGARAEQPAAVVGH